MSVYFATLNAFLEDTCVLAVVAWLLTRGRMLPLLLERRPNRHRTVVLGLILGLIGLTESIFPGARYPYVTHTLLVSFAALTGGLGVGLMAAGVVAMGALSIQSYQGAGLTIVAIVWCIVIGTLFHRFYFRQTSPQFLAARGVLVGSLGQIGAYIVYNLAAEFSRPVLNYPLNASWISIPANGMGMGLLLIVINDAKRRADNERIREESEMLRRETDEARARVAEAELTAIRSRVHPHFLFNTLTSIASLCSSSPEKAEKAVVRLGSLMRRSLETDAHMPVPLHGEVEAVRNYLEIEALRLAERMELEWSIDDSAGEALVPAFAVQILAENAVLHGISVRSERGKVAILIRRYPRHVLVSVLDNGVGISAAKRITSLNQFGNRLHGLSILNEQLVQLHGAPARLRLFSEINRGTLAIFIVPHDVRGNRTEASSDKGTISA